jgi:hypothetical protein
MTAIAVAGTQATARRRATTRPLIRRDATKSKDACISNEAGKSMDTSDIRDDSSRDKNRNITDVILRRETCNSSDASNGRDANNSNNSTSIRRDANRKRYVRNSMDANPPHPHC